MSRLILWAALFLSPVLAVSHEDHDDKPKAAAAKAGHDHDHESGSKEEDHGHDHGEEGESKEAESANVGPDKGIVEASEKRGFKLSPEALANFDLKLQKLDGSGPWLLPKSALVRSGEDVSVFRVRDGFFKRVDFKIRQASVAGPLVESSDLRAGDEIVVAGLGFLRIAELAAFGGVSHGHSH